MKNSSPMVSVIIAAYNAEETIYDSVESILNQTYEDFELLIADDSSSDSTKSIIDNFNDNRIRRFHNEKNMHVCWTWNNLLKQVKTPYVTFQDADDISYPKRLEKLINASNKNPVYAIIGANHLRPLKKWNTFRTSNFCLKNNEIWEKLKSTGSLESCGPRSLFKTSVIHQMNGFRELYPKCGMEDFDLILRIMHNHKIMNIPDVLYEYRYEPKSYSRINSKNEKAEKVFIYEIVIFLFNQRINNNGKDSLITGNLKPLNKFLESLKNKLKLDCSIPLRKKCMNQISNKDFKNAYLSAFGAIQLKPKNFKNYKCLLIALISNFKSIVSFFFLFNNYKKEMKKYK